MSEKFKDNLSRLPGIIFIRFPFIAFCYIFIRFGETCEKLYDYIDYKFEGWER